LNAISHSSDWRFSRRPGYEIAGGTIGPVHRGDAKIKAAEKLEEVKRLLEEVQPASPERRESLKSGLAKAIDELKKMVGMDK
jgi:hypothetical protein